jgi:TRAP-type C4-dicarboxylate transport system substrate-binding protein
MTTLMRILADAALAAAILFPFAARAQSPIIITFSHAVAWDTPKRKGAVRFKELSGKYTDGKVKVGLVTFVPEILLRPLRRLGLL